jgi:general secretion pathway protein G
MHKSHPNVSIAKRAGAAAQRGFTLIELLVVVVILGLLATVVMQNLLPETDNARVETVRTQLSNFESAVERFTLRKNGPPESFEELIEPDEANGGDPLAQDRPDPARSLG